MSAKTLPVLLRAADIAAAASRHSHPWNPNSELVGTMLSRMVGLRRTGVNLGRIPPGKESFIDHAHRSEEEWLYILAGRGVARIDGVEQEVGPGDFMGFPTPSVPHHLRNPFDEELVYLMGGENRELDVVDFPTVGRRMIRHGEEYTIYSIADGRPMDSGKPSDEE